VISQGCAAPQLRCGEIFYNYFIANCQQTVTVKKFENLLRYGEDMDNDKVCQFFWGHSVHGSK